MFSDYAARLLRRDWALGNPYLDSLHGRTGDVDRGDVETLSKAVRAHGKGLQQLVEELATMHRDEADLTHRAQLRIEVTAPDTIPKIPYAGTTNDYAALEVNGFGSAFSGADNTDVERGFAIIGNGVCRFNQLAVPGLAQFGGAVNFAGQVNINGAPAAIGRWVRFTLLGDISPAGSASASATVNEYFGGTDPGSTVTVVNTANTYTAMTGDGGWAKQKPDGTWEIIDLLGSIWSGSQFLTVQTGVTFSTGHCDCESGATGSVTRVFLTSVTPQLKCVTIDQYGRVAGIADGACP